MFKMITLASTASAILALQVADGGAQAVQTLGGLADRYGYPTVMLALALLVIVYLQRRSDKVKSEMDKERNDLVTKNNELTRELITEVKAGNSCKYERFSCPYEKPKEG